MASFVSPQMRIRPISIQICATSRMSSLARFGAATHARTRAVLGPQGGPLEDREQTKGRGHLCVCVCGVSLCGLASG